MKQSEIIYQYKSPVKRYGQTALLRIFQACIAGGILGLVVLFSPLLAAELKYRYIQADQLTPIEHVAIEEDTITSPGFEKLLNEKYIAQIRPVSSVFSIIIPKIGVNSIVIPQVDTTDKAIYEQALEYGAAHALGTALPGDGGTSYIFAHSTDYIWNITNYNAIFYLLKDMEPGDELYVVRNNTLIPYEVYDKKIIDANDTTYMQPNFDENKLVLQTCWPPGTTLKRMLIFAHPTGTLMGIGDTLTHSVDN